MSIGFKSLKKRTDFLKLRENCSSFKTKNFIFNFKIDKSIPVPVVGITISNKVGNAVKRNYIKRLIKSMISNTKSTIPKSLIIEVIAQITWAMQSVASPRLQHSWSQCYFHICQ